MVTITGSRFEYRYATVTVEPYRTLTRFGGTEVEVTEFILGERDARYIEAKGWTVKKDGTVGQRFSWVTVEVPTDVRDMLVTLTTEHADEL